MSTENKKSITTHNSTTEVPILSTPFKHIALAISGGGFRAGAYGLGVLSYLNHTSYLDTEEKTLLENVTYISSASGGTITSSLYALNCAKGKPFAAYYKKVFEQINDEKLITRALEILNDKKYWKNQQGKSHNTINSFALAYNELLFESATVKDLKANPTSHLEEVCFNSTELYDGLLFRQAIKLKEDQGVGDQEQFLYGNFNLHLKHETAEHLHLSDLLAASSCFPGGFEPMIFPRDFASTKTSKRELLNGLYVEIKEIKWDELYAIYGQYSVETLFEQMPKPVNPADFIAKVIQELPVKDTFDFCLMDGGITDNQGVESLVQANKRRVKRDSNFQPFDLMMVCDVDMHYTAPYQLPDESHGKLPTIHMLQLTASIIAVVSLIGSIAIFNWLPLSDGWKGVFVTILGLIGILSVTLLLLIETTKRKIKGESKGSGLDKIFTRKITALLFKHFGYLPFSKLKFFITVRITSLLMLASNVFMSRIRYLLYDQFFNQGNLKRTGRAKANHIYDLALSNDKNRKKHYTHKHQPSIDMQIIAEYASKMPTTLWFSKDGPSKKMQSAITACGQFTTCYNLIDYIEKLKTGYDNRDSVYSQLAASEQQIVDNLQVRMEKDYAHFQADPFWLYNKLGHDYQLDKFIPATMQDREYPDQYKGLR